MRKGCGREYQPRRWNQRYCQDPECQREIRRWQAARRQARRRQDAAATERRAGIDGNGRRCAPPRHRRDRRRLRVPVTVVAVQVAAADETTRVRRPTRLSERAHINLMLLLLWRGNLR